MSHFYGRSEELEELQSLTYKTNSSFLVVMGRRRIGKSRLVREFARKFDHFIRFEGAIPDEIKPEENSSPVMYP